MVLAKTLCSRTVVFTGMNLTLAFGFCLCILNQICNGSQRDVIKSGTSNIAREIANDYHDTLKEKTDLGANIEADVLYINEDSSSDWKGDVSDADSDADVSDSDTDDSRIHPDDQSDHPRSHDDASGAHASGKYHYIHLNVLLENWKHNLYSCQDREVQA